MSLIYELAQAILRGRRRWRMSLCTRPSFPTPMRLIVRSSEFRQRLMVLSRQPVEAAQLLLQALNDPSQRREFLEELMGIQSVEDEMAVYVLQRPGGSLLKPFEEADIHCLAVGFGETLRVIKETGDVLRQCRDAEMPASVLESSAIMLEQCKHLSRATMLLGFPDLVCNECHEARRLEHSARSVLQQEIEAIECRPESLLADHLCDLFVRLVLTTDAAEQAAHVIEHFVLQRNKASGVFLWT